MARGFDAGASQANFVAEVDGVAAFEATEAEGFNKTHEPYQIQVGNKEMPYQGRGKSKCDEVTLKGAFKVTNAGADFHRQFQEYSRGDSVRKVNVRVVQMSEDGKSPIATHECIDCVPTGFKPMGNKAGEKDAAMFEIKFQPSDYKCFGSY